MQAQAALQQNVAGLNLSSARNLATPLCQSSADSSQSRAQYSPHSLPKASNQTVPGSLFWGNRQLRSGLSSHREAWTSHVFFWESVLGLHLHEGRSVKGQNNRQLAAVRCAGPPRPPKPRQPPGPWRSSSKQTKQRPPAGAVSTAESETPQRTKPTWKKLGPQDKVNLRRRVVRRTASHLSMQKQMLKSPQLSEEGAGYPLLSACLPPLPFSKTDHEWMEENLDEIKYALGYPLPEMEDAPRPGPLDKLDDLIYLSYMHKAQEGRSRTVKVSNSRLAYLGQYVLDVAMAEFLLQRYPRETPAALRERAEGMAGKRGMARLLTSAGLDRLVFPTHPLYRVERTTRHASAKMVFLALLATAYLTLGMPEVYRILFEVFGLDPDSPEALPRAGRPEDEDFVVPELDGKPLTWQQVASYQPPVGSLFAHPLLFRACVPPGMHRFRGSDWFYSSLGPVLDALAYPRPSPPHMDLTAKQTRNEELVLALQLAFTHTSLYKADHPRFCFDRLQYLGSKIQDLVVAEQLLMQYLDGPILWLEDKHGGILRNSLCGRYLKEKRLDKHILVSNEFREMVETNRRVGRSVAAAVHQAIHGVGYLVYGKAEVKRLMFSVWKLNDEHVLPGL